MPEAFLPGPRLPRSFFARDARVVARALLGTVLVHDDPHAGRLAARIVETEAYLGREDPGSHAFRGPTPRSRVMFGPPARLYVYFTYGMHWCTNVVCGEPGEGAAVLLRGAAPLAGLEVMRARRPTARRDEDLLAGPARLSLALGLSGVHNDTSLLRGGAVRIAEGSSPEVVGESTRVGLRRGEDLPWRYYVAGDPHVSRPPRPAGRRG